jgi:hypothetical protein
LQDQLNRVKWFTSLDLKEAYYWVWMKKGKEWKTAFWTRYRHYEYTVMLFELKNFCHLSKINQWHIERILNDFVITYLDDILIYSDDLEMHCSHVHKVLKSLMKGFVCEKSKSRFETKKIKFLIMLFNLSKSRRTQRKWTQSETDLHQNESRKYKSFKVDKLLLKVCI